MISEQRFAGLVDAIYEAGEDQTRWSSVLRRIACSFHARTVVFGMYGLQPNDSCTIAPDVDQSVHDRYAAYYHEINPIWRRTIDMAPGEVRTDAMIVPRSQFTKTEFFHDFLRPQDVGSMLGVAAHNENGRLCVVSVQRARPFEVEDVALYRRLAPHVRRAVQLQIRLAQAEMRSSFALDALDHLPQKLLLLDGASRLVFANEAARALFVGTGGLSLVGNVLLTRSRAETDRLHSLVAGCGSRSPDVVAGGVLAISRGEGRPKITLSVMPLRTRSALFETTPSPVAIIFADEPQTSRQPDLDEIMGRFGLTPKEAGLAVEILAGGTLQDCPDRLGITRATAQTHLAHIFQKTGTRRQAELVSLLLRS